MAVMAIVAMAGGNHADMERDLGGTSKREHDPGRVQAFYPLGETLVVQDLLAKSKEEARGTETNEEGS